MDTDGEILSFRFDLAAGTAFHVLARTPYLRTVLVGETTGGLFAGIDRLEDLGLLHRAGLARRRWSRWERTPTFRRPKRGPRRTTFSY